MSSWEKKKGIGGRGKIPNRPKHGGATDRPRSLTIWRPAEDTGTSGCSSHEGKAKITSDQKKKGGRLRGGDLSSRLWKKLTSAANADNQKGSKRIKNP